MDQKIWRWTLTSEAIAPCFVRDVLDMRPHADTNLDFFWLGHTPCRSVLLVAMVVAVQVYDKRSIYTIDDGTAVIDCVLRHAYPKPPATANPRCSSPTKKPLLDKPKPSALEPPPPITQPGYPVRVVGRVMRYYESRQIHAETIDLCPSSLDEITHLEHVIELHNTKYSCAAPFVPPQKPTSTSSGADTNAFFDTLRSDPSNPSYSLRPPRVQTTFENQNLPPPIPTHVDVHDPSSPTALSAASSTPSSPCKPSSPQKTSKEPRETKMRHPSRVHTRDLTANTFRLYVKHYMDNAPPPFPVSHSPSYVTHGGHLGAATTPTKHMREACNDDEQTPRPNRRTGICDDNNSNKEDEDASKLGFTLSHLRRVPELALLAARVVRAEARRRDKANQEKRQGSSRIPLSTSARLNRHEDVSTLPIDPLHRKMKRLFSWAVVRLYEEGTIVLWDGDVRPLPVPPPPGPETGGDDFWRRGHNTLSTITEQSVLYTLSASAPLYSRYVAREQTSERNVVDADVDPANLSDPPVDEEAYVPLTPRFLVGHVREALSAVRRRPVARGASGKARGRDPSPGDVLAYMQRTDGRWARVGVWAIEDALALLRAGRGPPVGTGCA